MMKMSNVAAIADDNIVTIEARFAKSAVPYTFKATRTLASTLQVADQVIVETINGTQVVTVASVSNTCDIDPHSDIEYRWAYQRVDHPALAQLQKKEDEIVSRLETHRRDQVRKQALAALGFTNEDMQALLAPDVNTTK